MARFLRKVRKGRWARAPWLNDTRNEHQADSLLDLEVDGNTLSVYLTDTDTERDQAIAGLAANCSNITNVDYAFFDGILLQALNVTIEQEDAETPHAKANALHHNISQLTANSILALVRSVPTGKVTRVQKVDVKKLLTGAVKDGFINKEKLSSSIREELGV